MNLNVKKLAILSAITVLSLTGYLILSSISFLLPLILSGPIVIATKEPPSEYDILLKKAKKQLKKSQVEVSKLLQTYKEIAGDLLVEVSLLDFGRKKEDATAEDGFKVYDMESSHAGLNFHSRDEQLKALKYEAKAIIESLAELDNVPRDALIGKQVEPPVKVKKDKNLVSSGIPRLDVALGGGFPRGSSILLVEDTGTGGDIFSYQFLQNGFESGESGYCFSTDLAPNLIVKELERRGMNTDSYDKKERFILLDAYTYPALITRKTIKKGSKKKKKEKTKPEESSEVSVSADPRKVVTLITTILNKLGKKKIRGCFYTYTTYIMGLKADDAINLFRRLRVLDKECNSTSIYVVHKGLHNTRIMASLEHMADGVVELSVKEGIKGQLERYIRVRSMRGRDFDDAPIPYNVLGRDIRPMEDTQIRHKAPEESEIDIEKVKAKLNSFYES
ncbi:MAG: RAD55 family ATPase [Promethearchaeota archaeon]